MNIIGRRKIWYTISLLMIIPGIISLIMNGLQLGIDFKGGSLMEVQGRVSQQEVSSLAEPLGLKDVTVTPSGEDRTLIRYRDEADPTVQEENHQKLKNQLAERGHQELRFDTVGPSISRDITRNALLSILAVSIAIVLYISYAFRNVPPPVSSWSFGVMAIVALLHDSLLVLGIFSILGVVFGTEIDALFVTAILTVIGFSVHDTIVVFDRIRENLRRRKGAFEEIVNSSILETLARSLNTSVTIIFVLLSMYLFGGETLKNFTLALLIGIAAGTFSSIFNASPLLVTLHNYRLKQAAKARS